MAAIQRNLVLKNQIEKQNKKSVAELQKWVEVREMEWFEI